MAALTLHNVSVARGGLPVLSGVGFSLKSGEALVLTGANGIGKTTLLRAVAGLQPVRAGRVEAAEDSIAYAAHADGLKTTLTARENLEFWARIFGNHTAVAEALSAMSLRALAERAAGALSAGQKRRLGLARLIVTKRPVWVLDEPTVSLDRASVQMFGDAIRAHLDQGGAALLASHIDLGLGGRASELDLSEYKADPNEASDGGQMGFNEAFG